MSNQSAKVDDLRLSNIMACVGVLETIRTSLGPRGMDKMVTTPDDQLIVTNDGATIMKQLAARHPAARMLVELSAAQDVEAGDGTTSVVVFAASLLSECLELFKLDIHPTKIAEAFLRCVSIAQDVISLMANDVAIPDSAAVLDQCVKVLKARREGTATPDVTVTEEQIAETQRVVEIVRTCLSSKIIGPNSHEIAPICMKAVLRVRDPNHRDRVDLSNIRVIQREGGVLRDTCLLENGFVFTRKAAALPIIRARGPDGGVRRVRALALTKQPKIVLCQFCLAPPKTHLDSSVCVNNYEAMDALIKEEQNIARTQAATIAESGARVVIIQKNVLREAASELFLSYASNAGLMVIADVEAKDIDFLSRTTGATPIAALDYLSPEVLGTAGEIRQKDGMVFLTGCESVQRNNAPQTATILVRGHNTAVTAEAERSIHDALCVVRCLVKRPQLVVGGAAVESLVAATLDYLAASTTGVNPHCYKAYAHAARLIPATLAENAGLPPLQMVSQLLAAHDAPRRLVVQALPLVEKLRELKAKRGSAEPTDEEKQLEAQIAQFRHQIFEAADKGLNMENGVISSMRELHVLQPALVSSSMLQLATEMATQILKINEMVLCNF